MREVNEDDLQVIAKLEERSKQAKDKVRQLVIEQGLEMKIIDVAYNFDQMQLFISFTAENRVDFDCFCVSWQQLLELGLNFAKLGQEMRLKFMVDLDLVDVLCAVLSLFMNFQMFQSKWPKIKIYL